ncbi:MAG: signal transduction histidine kinase [Chthonomonadaceae bacterium]|nr:signal transduction histidine kinase [Chthonomonadaceae bacterium]
MNVLLLTIIQVLLTSAYGLFLQVGFCRYDGIGRRPEMQISIVIPIIAAATCFQYAMLFLLLWNRHKNLGHLRTFSLFSASLSVMTLSTFVLQHVEGANAAFTGLQAYRIQSVSICTSVALLLQFSTEITGRPLPRVLEQNRLILIAITLAFLAFTPFVLHLPPAGTLPDDFDYQDAGPLFLPYMFVLIVGACSAVVILYRGVRVQREQLRTGVHTGTAYFGDIRLFLLGVVLFIPSGIYELVGATGRITESANAPNARALSVIVLCTLTGQLLVNDIFENYRKKREAEIQAKIYLDTMSYAAHQVRANADSVLWHLTATLNSLHRNKAPAHQIAEIMNASDETNELKRIFNSMLLAARDSLGAGINLGPSRYGYLSEYIEQLCRKRIETACRARGWNGEGEMPYLLRLHSELDQPVLFSRDGLYHILAILMDNAIKYSAAGSPIDVRVWHEDNQVHILIQDCGIGITPGLEEAIFTPYGRGDVEQRAVEITGNGIGLPLARRIAESLGGTLRAESGGHNLGSAFILTFPLEMEDLNAAQSQIFTTPPR